MPRGGSGGRAGPRPAARAPRRDPPAPASRSPPPAPAQGGGGSGGLGAVVAEGLAFGTGSAVAHRAVDAVMGPRVIHQETVTSSTPASAVSAPPPAPNTSSRGSDACSAQLRAFQECLNSYGNDIRKCQLYMDTLSECRKGSGAMLSA